MFCHPFYPEVTERGVKEGKEYLEKPIGDDQRKHIGSGKFGCKMVKCDEHENDRIDELAGHGTQIIPEPKHFPFAQLLKLQED